MPLPPLKKTGYPRVHFIPRVASSKRRNCEMASTWLYSFSAAIVEGAPERSSSLRPSVLDHHGERLCAITHTQGEPLPSAVDDGRMQPRLSSHVLPCRPLTGLRASYFVQRMLQPCGPPPARDDDDV